jgi:hypothetical protein
MRHERNIKAVRSLGRYRTVDMLTYDSAMFAHDSSGNQMGKPLGYQFRTHDGLAQISNGRWATVDSTGAFLVGELERLDLTLHEPLASVTWPRDVQLREDVSVADELSSFTVSTFTSGGGLGTGQVAGKGKAWIGKDTTQISRVSVDIAKITQPLIPWAKEIAYTVLELESAAKLGRPVDEQKYRALQLAFQMEVDEQVYYGDVPMAFYGLVNSDRRTGQDAVANVANVANGAQGTSLWTNKTPNEILQDLNEALVSAWAQTGWAVMPTDVLLPPAAFGYIATQMISQAGSDSVLNYLLRNNITSRQGGAVLDIRPVKWNVGAGVGGTLGTSNGHDRMVIYSNDRERVRFPMTLLSKTPIQYDAIWHKTTYWGRLGVLEIIYPETVAYRDGVS